MGTTDLKDYQWKPLEQIYRETPEVSNNQAIREQYVGFAGIWCKFLMAFNHTQTLGDDVVRLVHAPLNCNACARSFKTQLFSNWGQPFPHAPSTGMNRDHVIFGGADRLYDSILAVDKDYRPRLIMVLTGCAPGLTADDVARVAARAQGKVEAKVVYVSSEGYEGVYLGKAIEEVSEQFVKLMDPPERVDPEAVNIIGHDKEVFLHEHQQGGCGNRFRFPTDGSELARYVEGLGLKVHRVLMSGNYDYIRTAPGAAVNTIDCGTWGYPLAMAMQRSFGTPYLRHELPLGVEAPSRWIRDLATFAKREEKGEALIAEEYAAIQETWERCRELVQGRVVIMEGQTFNRSTSIGRMCKELGLKVYHVCHPMDLKAKHFDAEYYIWYGYNELYLDGPFEWQKKISPKSIMDSLGLSGDQVIYFYTDVYPECKSGSFDPSDTPRVDTSVHLRRVRNAPGRGVGFRGAKGIAEEIIESIMASKRKTSSTLYGRLMGKAFNFDQGPAASGGQGGGK